MGIELLIILTTMSNKKKRFILPEEEIPQYWYNIQADMVNKPMPPLHPGTKQPLKAEDLYPIFAEELCRQELNQTDTWIEIPEVQILPQHSAGARLWIGESARHTGTYLLQERERQPDGLAQAELRHPTGILLQAGGSD